MATRVRKTELSPDSALQSRLEPADFVDCYTVSSPLPPRRAAEIITQFPGWVRWLLGLRTALVAPFGLKARGPQKGDSIGWFPVQQETDDEIILGFDDRHLDFRISVRAQAGDVSMATWVRRHNWAGRLYLALVMPFHVAIVRNGMSRLAVHVPAG